MAPTVPTRRRGSSARRAACSVPPRMRVRLAVRAPLAARVLGVALVAAAVLAPAAQAGPALTPVGGKGACVGGAGAARVGCIEARGLQGAVTAEFAGRGRHLYVGSVYAGGLFALRRDPRSGRLSKIPGTPHCWGSQAGCSEPPGEQMMPRSIAIPGDERHVYVPVADVEADYGDSSRIGVAGYERDAGSGALKPLAAGIVCPQARSGGGCTAPRGGLLQHLAATRDGRFVYGSSAYALVVLARDAAGGGLRQLDGEAGCVDTADGSRDATTDVSGCAKAHAIGEANGIALSSDDRFLYVAGVEPQHGRGDGYGLSVLRRDPQSGALTPLQTLRPRNWVGGPRRVLATGDGRAVYVVDGNFAVHALRRLADGRLAPVGGKAGCVDLVPGCTPAPGSSSPQLLAAVGRTVYTADAEALDVWRRRADGGLQRLRGRDGCLTRNGRTDTGNVDCHATRLRAITGLGGLAASPDGRHLYLMGSWHSQGRGVGIVEVARRR